MIGRRDIRRIFSEEMPAHVTALFRPHDEFVRIAGYNHFIQAQCEAGIYEDLADELLSTAMSYPMLDVVHVDAQQMIRLMAGVPRDVALGWVRWTARHERMHFEFGHIMPVSLEEQSEREVSVNKYIETHYPRLHNKAQRAEQLSTGFQRVLQRKA